MRYGGLSGWLPEPEPQVLDRFPLPGEHFFEPCLHVETLRPQGTRIDIVGVLQITDVGPTLQLFQGIGKQAGVVGLEPHHTTWAQNLLVKVQEPGIGQPPFDVSFLRSWIREGDPYLVDFTLTKKEVDVQDVGTKKPDVGNILLYGQCAPLPDAVAFDINPDVIALRKQLGQSNGILSPTAGEFDGNGMVVLKIGRSPLILDGGIQRLAWFNHIIAVGNDGKAK